VSADDNDTLDRACDLGIAFQLGNIARDIAEDCAISRCYLPLNWLTQAGIAPADIMAPHHRPALMRMAARLAQIAETYENSARIGAAKLPFRSRWAVLSAAGIYGAISRKVVRAGSTAWDQRISTGKLAKLGHVLRALGQSALPPTIRDATVAHPRAELARATLAAFTA
jgi:phytoene synthase